MLHKHKKIKIGDFNKTYALKICERCDKRWLTIRFRDANRTEKDVAMNKGQGFSYPSYTKKAKTMINKFRKGGGEKYV